MAKIELTELGTVVLTPQVFKDLRGTFAELHRMSDLARIMRRETFVQSNVSISGPFTLRGMHYQLGTCSKLIRCLSGSAYQVAVDVRLNSPTFGKYIAHQLSAESFEAVYVPSGFANGFMTFADGAIIHYEMTGYYDEAKERQLRWNCSVAGIRWPLGPGANLTISPKDRQAPGLAEIERWRA